MCQGAQSADNIKLISACVCSSGVGSMCFRLHKCVCVFVRHVTNACPVSFYELTHPNILWLICSQGHKPLFCLLSRGSLNITQTHTHRHTCCISHSVSCAFTHTEAETSRWEDVTIKSVTFQSSKRDAWLFLDLHRHVLNEMLQMSSPVPWLLTSLHWYLP